MSGDTWRCRVCERPVLADRHEFWLNPRTGKLVCSKCTPTLDKHSDNPPQRLPKDDA